MVSVGDEEHPRGGIWTIFYKKIERKLEQEELKQWVMEGRVDNGICERKLTLKYF